MSDTVDISSLLKSGDVPAWKQDDAFIRFVEAAMPIAYERYSDPKNRAKGEPPEAIGDAVDLLIDEIVELLDAILLAEANGWRDTVANDAFRWELGDVLWCSMIAARAGRLC